MSASGSTREKLIAAAFVVVARDGLDAASVKVIAAEAGVTPGLLHYHFASKEALIEAAMQAALSDYLARQSDTVDLATYFQDARSAAVTDRDFFKMRLAMAVRALADPAQAQAMADLNRVAANAMAQALAKAGGNPDPQRRHQILATALKACFDGIMLASLIDPDFPLDEVAAFLEQAATDWLETPPRA